MPCHWTSLAIAAPAGVSAGTFQSGKHHAGRLKNRAPVPSSRPPPHHPLPPQKKDGNGEKGGPLREARPALALKRLAGRRRPGLLASWLPLSHSVRSRAPDSGARPRDKLGIPSSGFQQVESQPERTPLTLTLG